MKRTPLTGWLSLLLRTAITLAALLWLGQRWGHHYVEALFPLYHAVLDAALPNFAVLHINILAQNGEPLVAVHLKSIYSLTAAGSSIPAGVTIDASTLAGHALKHVVIIVGAVMIWPSLTLRERGARLLLSILPLLFLEAIDIPLALAGAVQDLMTANHPPNSGNGGTWLTTWLHLLDGGGRFALSLLVAGAIAGFRETHIGISLAKTREPSL